MDIETLKKLEKFYNISFSLKDFMVISNKADALIRHEIQTDM